MKIAGHDLTQPRTREIEIAGLKLTIRALSGAFVRKIDRILPFPSDPNEIDPIEHTRIYCLIRMAIIHEGLSMDPNVSWETKRENFQDDVSFYDGLQQELGEIDYFTAEELNELQKEILAIKHPKLMKG